MRTLCTIIFLAFVVSVCAQDEVLFREMFKPGKVYVTELDLLIDGKMNLDASADIMEDLAEQGMARPIAIKGKNTMVMRFETGELTADGLIPVRIEYVKAHSSMEVMNEVVDEDGPMTGMVVYGKYDKDMNLMVDSITNIAITEEQKAVFLETINTLQGKIDFPGHAMKVGDTFTQMIPLTIPIAGMAPLEMKTELTYRLVSISEGIARFEVEQKLKMEMSDKTANINASADGKGFCEYDISNSKLTGNDMILDISMRLDMGGMYLVFSYRTTTHQTTTISGKL